MINPKALINLAVKLKTIMRTIVIFMFAAIILGCKQDPEPKHPGIGVDYILKKDRENKKPNIKAEDTANFKTFKKQSDSVIYSRLMDFGDNKQESKIQSLKISESKANVLSKEIDNQMSKKNIQNLKLKKPVIDITGEDIEEGYRKFKERTDRAITAAQKKKQQEASKMFLENLKNNNKPTDQIAPGSVTTAADNKNTLGKNALMNSEVQGNLSSDFDEALHAVAGDHKNNFANIIGTKIEDKSRIFGIKHNSKVQFPLAQSAYVIKNEKSTNEVIVEYLSTTNKNEAEDFYEALIQLYKLNGIDKTQLICKESKSKYEQSVIMVPGVPESNKNYGLLIIISCSEFHSIDSKKFEAIKNYNVTATFKANVLK